MIIGDRSSKLIHVNVVRIVVSLVLALSAAATAYLVWRDLRPETKERLSPATMERLVEVPIAAVREDGLPAGERQFDRLVAKTEARYGSGSVQAADLREAFGVGLYGEWGNTGDRALLEASRDHLHTAVSSYRAAFGPDDPEVAVALHTFADVEIELHDGPTPQALAALREALSIRREALGAWNKETRATEELLASMKRESARRSQHARRTRHEDEIEVRSRSLSLPER